MTFFLAVGHRGTSINSLEEELIEITQCAHGLVLLREVFAIISSKPFAFSGLKESRDVRATPELEFLPG